MIGDPSHTISLGFDVLDERGIVSTWYFIIDPDGVVISTWKSMRDGVGRDASVLIDKIHAAQYVRSHPGEVCPAKWKEGIGNTYTKS